MRTINQYINESLTSNQKFFCEQFVIMMKGITFTKDSIKLMLNNLSMDILKALSEYFNEKDSSNYMSYEPNSDLFDNDENKDKVTNQIAEYIEKYCK